MSVPPSFLPPVAPILSGALDLLKAGVTSGKVAAAPPPQQPTRLDNLALSGAYGSILLSSVGGSTTVAAHLLPNFAKTYAHPISFVQTIKAPLAFMPAMVAFTVGLKKDDPMLTFLGAAGMGTASGGFRWIETVAKESPSQLIRVAPAYFKTALAITAIGVGMQQLASAFMASPSAPPTTPAQKAGV